MREKFADGLEASKLPAKPGLTVVEMSRPPRRARLKALYVMGENMMLSDPTCTIVEKSAQRPSTCLVVQDIFLTETTEFADVVLPAACFAEKDGTFTNTERRVQRVRKAVEPRRGPHRLGDHRRSARMGYPMKYAKPPRVWTRSAR